MRVKDIMSTNVVVIDEKTSIHDARKIMQAHKIRRLPVMKKDKLMGLITERMLLEASPSRATSLSIHELHYLLANMTVDEIMVKTPGTVSPDMPVEEALQLGRKMGYGAFPVVEDGKLVGVVTESDIVRIMTRVLGAREKGTRIDLTGSKEFGNMQKIMEVLDKHKIVLLSMMTLPPEDNDNGEWSIFLRLKTDDADPIAKDLVDSGFTLLDVS